MLLLYYILHRRLLVKDMFLSVCHRHQCMDHNSVCYDSGEWLLCEIWCTETTTEDHHHHTYYYNPVLEQLELYSSEMQTQAGRPLIRQS